MTTTISGSSPRAPATAALTPRPDVPGTCRIWVAAAFVLGRSRAARSRTRTPPGASRGTAAPMCAGELYLSVNTVRTHQRHLYQKLGARSRTQAVAQARALDLLAPSPRRC